jgi:hypothetical protein
VSKRKGSPYSSGRSPHWLKSKNPRVGRSQARNGGRLGEGERGGCAAGTAVLKTRRNGSYAAALPARSNGNRSWVPAGPPWGDDFPPVGAPLRNGGGQFEGGFATEKNAYRDRKGGQCEHRARSPAHRLL